MVFKRFLKSDLYWENEESKRYVCEMNAEETLSIFEVLPISEALDEENPLPTKKSRSGKRITEISTSSGEKHAKMAEVESHLDWESIKWDAAGVRVNDKLYPIKCCMFLTKE